MGWDVETCKPLFRVENTVSDKEMNTVNSLNFAHGSDQVFVCGTRDGYIKIFDTRHTTKPSIAFRAHGQKLNSATFNQENTGLLTCARDSLIRLWDLRRLIHNPIEVPSAMVAELKGFISKSYNISSTLVNSDKNVLAGSEDGNVYLYDLLTRKVVKRWYTGDRVIHFLRVINPSPPYEFMFSSLEDSSIRFVGPSLVPVDMQERPEPQLQNNAVRETMEEMMGRFGDSILRLMHKQNWPQRIHGNSGSFLEFIMHNADEESRTLQQEMCTFLLEKMGQQLENLNRPSEVAVPNTNNEETKEKLLPKTIAKPEFLSRCNHKTEPATPINFALAGLQNNYCLFEDYFNFYRDCKGKTTYDEYRILAKTGVKAKTEKVFANRICNELFDISKALETKSLNY